jgi:cysteine-rich repeat protein
LLAAAAAGCMTAPVDDGAETPLTISPDPIATLPMQGIYATYADGHRGDGIFSSAAQVYVAAKKGTAAGPVQGPIAVSGGLVLGAAVPGQIKPLGTDYYVAVFDDQMHQLSTDALGCRRIRIGLGGAIETSYAGTAGGAPCQHAMSADLARDGSGGVTVALGPFARSTTHDGHGRETYVLAAIPVDAFDGRFDGAGSLRASFRIAVPPAAPTCGDGVVQDGEECDDGNTADGDGCSSTCTHECDGSDGH